jgi:signal transduction histidine kinase
VVFILLKYHRSERKLHVEQEKEVMHLMRYKQLFSNMPIAYLRYFIRRKIGSGDLLYNLISKNRVADTDFGAHFDKLEKSMFSLVNKSDVLAVAEGKPTFRAELFMPDSSRYYDVFFCASEQKSVIDIFIVDKTEQIEASRQVIEYAKMNGRILHMLPDTIIIFNPDLTVDQLLNPVPHNSLAPSMDIVGKQTADFYVSGVTERLNLAIQKTIYTNELATFDYQIVDKGNTYYFNARLNTLSGTKVCCIIHEYTDMMLNQLQLEQAKNELEHVNHKLQMVINAANVVPWTIDCVAGKLYFGDVEYELSDNCLIHPDDRALYAAKIGEVLKTDDDGKVFSYSIRLKMPDESYEWHEIHCSVDKRDNRGNVSVIIGSAANIDKQRQIEDNLREAKEKAEESSRLKSTFLANVSHEIRTPLNAIVGFSNVLASTPDLSEKEKKEFIASIDDNNQLLLQLVNDILDISLMDMGMMEYTYSEENITMVMHTVVEKMREKQSNKKVELLLDEDLPVSCMTYTDVKRFVQVMNNLITNALKFTYIGSVRVGYRITGEKMLYCYVTDTGVGIDARYQKQIFERFEKLDQFQQGTGLGLSICKSIVEALGGRIGVVSEKGKGSTFWFTLPILSECPPTPDE